MCGGGLGSIEMEDQCSDPCLANRRNALANALQYQGFTSQDLGVLGDAQAVNS